MPHIARNIDRLVAHNPNLDITPYFRNDPNHVFSIGTGSFGDVFRGFYSCLDQRGRPCQAKVVIKVLLGTREDRERVEKRLCREVETWRKLSHPNVAQFLGIARRQPHHMPGIVSLYMPRGGLLQYTGQHPNCQQRMASEIIQGLSYLHQNGIIHGDLKSDNVLVSENGAAVINDFGASRVLGIGGYTTATIANNRRFAAPELMSESEHMIYPTFESDIYSLGLLLLQLFHWRGPEMDQFRHFPYNHIRRGLDHRLAALIRKGHRPRRELYNPISDQHWDIMSWCWQHDPLSRPALSDVLRAI